MDGIETLGKILDHDNQMPVILNTAYSSYKDDFMTWAADAYVIKSHDTNELHKAIAEVLTKRGIAVPAAPAEAGER
jgi:two-component SAPR family response regulator